MKKRTLASEGVFVAKVQQLRRIVIPKGVARALGIREGDEVMIRIWKKKEAEENSG